MDNEYYLIRNTNNKNLFIHEIKLIEKGNVHYELKYFNLDTVMLVKKDVAQSIVNLLKFHFNTPDNFLELYPVNDWIANRTIKHKVTQ